MITRRIRLVSMSCLALLLAGSAVLALSLSQEDPAEILKEADRLAFLRNWSRAEPLFARAEQLFRERGDERNTLYAMVGKLRGQLPRLPLQELRFAFQNPGGCSREPLLRGRTILSKREL